MASANQTKLAAARAFVDGAIQESKERPGVVVFVKSQCEFCKKTVALLSQALGDQSKLRVVEVDHREDIIDVQHCLREKTGTHVVPRVFIAGEPTGGLKETTALAESGELAAKLKAAGIA